MFEGEELLKGAWRRDRAEAPFGDLLEMLLYFGKVMRVKVNPKDPAAAFVSGGEVDTSIARWGLEDQEKERIMHLAQKAASFLSRHATTYRDAIIAGDDVAITRLAKISREAYTYDDELRRVIERLYRRPIPEMVRKSLNRELGRLTIALNEFESRMIDLVAPSTAQNLTQAIDILEREYDVPAGVIEDIKRIHDQEIRLHIAFERAKTVGQTIPYEFHQIPEIIEDLGKISEELLRGAKRREAPKGLP